jgi:hypothetical protein
VSPALPLAAATAATTTLAFQVYLDGVSISLDGLLECTG